MPQRRKGEWPDTPEERAWRTRAWAQVIRVRLAIESSRQLARHSRVVVARSQWTIRRTRKRLAAAAQVAPVNPGPAVVVELEPRRRVRR
ncbi:MAG TPA: hypothetical protein VKA21_04780 [Candidatus Binatia bacterium]|nr:hypothetical protein [Candidatus Binatia bacterium]